MTIRSISLAGLLAMATSLPLSAQNVYRCGDTYSQQPCPGGSSVPVADPRTAAQKSQADAVIRREAQSAQAQEKARLQREAQGPAVSVLQPSPAAPAPAAQDKPPVTKHKKARKPSEYFTAKAPDKPKAPKSPASPKAPAKPKTPQP